jgi:stage V sporulation protein B
MSKKVGPEGLGLYELVCSIYFFLASFSTSGICLAITRLIADCEAVNQKQKAKLIFRKCLLINCVIGIISFFLLFYFSEFIAHKVLKDYRAEIPLKVLSMGLPFLAFSSCFRGYFYAKRHIIKTASEQLLEQIFEMLVFFLLISNIKTKNTEYACISIVTGTSISEAISCLQSYLMYKFENKKKCNCNKLSLILTNKNKSQIKYKILKQIYKISLPITASSVLKNGFDATEDILIPWGLYKFGSSVTKSLFEFGMIKGMVMPIISFPSVLINAFSVLIVPEISQINVIENKKNIKYLSSKMLHFTFVFSIFISFNFMLYSLDLTNLLYKSSICGNYLFIFAPVVPFFYLDNILNGILVGLNQQVYCLTCNIINSLVRVSLIFLILPYKGVAGLIATIFISEIFNFNIIVYRLIKVTDLKIDCFNWVIKPLLCAVFSCIFIKFILQIILPQIYFLFYIIFSLVLYLFMLFYKSFLKKFKVFKKLSTVNLH